jgi:nitrite reductase/ring-hydroxylating ferredoxin subunit
MAAAAEVIEATVAQLSALRPGEMREVTVGKVAVLVSRDLRGQVHATGAKCTHYGAPLVKGTCAPAPPTAVAAPRRAQAPR